MKRVQFPGHRCIRSEMFSRNYRRTGRVRYKSCYQQWQRFKWPNCHPAFKDWKTWPYEFFRTRKKYSSEK